MTFTTLSELYSLIVPAIAAIAGAISGFVFTKLRKRTEEVNVTGNEHDTVKRISQSSIETIERLNIFSEQLSEKMLEQRSAFNSAISKLELEIDNLKILNNELRDKNDALHDINIKLHKVIDELTNRPNTQ